MFFYQTLSLILSKYALKGLFKEAFSKVPDLDLAKIASLMVESVEEGCNWLSLGQDAFCAP